MYAPRAATHDLRPSRSAGAKRRLRAPSPVRPPGPRASPRAAARATRVRDRHWRRGRRSGRAGMIGLAPPVAIELEEQPRHRARCGGRPRQRALGNQLEHGSRALVVRALLPRGPDRSSRERREADKHDEGRRTAHPTPRRCESWAHEVLYLGRTATRREAVRWLLRMKWLDAMVQRRPLVVVEDHWLSQRRSWSRRSPTRGRSWLARSPRSPSIAPVLTPTLRYRRLPATPSRVLVVVPDTADLKDPSAAARLIARYLRPGGLLVQDVQLSTLPFVPADRWWESIYCVAATVRGLFAEQAPEVRFLSNKRGYAATFGRDLAEAGFDPRDVMDKAELSTVVVPTLVRYLDTAFPMRLSTRISGQRSSWRVSLHDAERRALSSSLDLLLWIDPPRVGARRAAGQDRSAGARAESARGEQRGRILAGPADRTSRRRSGLSVVSVGERVGPSRRRSRRGDQPRSPPHAYPAQPACATAARSSPRITPTGCATILEIGICRRSHA